MRFAGAMLNTCENIATDIHLARGDSRRPDGTYVLDGKALSKTGTVPERGVASPAACFHSRAAQQKGQNALLVVAESLLLVYYNHRTH
jgi:hypothetical protein